MFGVDGTFVPRGSGFKMRGKISSGVISKVIEAGAHFTLIFSGGGIILASSSP